MEKYYTPEQVAELLQVKVTTVWTWIKKGKLKASSVGRLYRIAESSVKQLFNNDGEEQE